MKNLFDPVLAEDTRQRILRLKPDCERQWGSMVLPQTLAHCTAALKMAMGESHPKRASFPANVIGLLIKPIALRTVNRYGGTPLRRRIYFWPILYSASLRLSERSFLRHLIALPAAVLLVARGILTRSLDS